jgi:phosphomevalonate kinase
MQRYRGNLPLVTFFVINEFESTTQTYCKQDQPYYAFQTSVTRTRYNTSNLIFSSQPYSTSNWESWLLNEVLKNE